MCPSKTPVSDNGTKGKGTIRDCALVAVLLLIVFGVFAGIGAEERIAALTRTQAHSSTFALVAVALLALDVYLPIPSSIVIAACGTVMGFVPGTGVALVGLALANLVGYGTGRLWARRNGNLKAESDPSLWVLSLVALSRPIPIASETGSIVAGKSGISLLKFFIAGLVGSAPYAAVLAFAGSRL